LLALLAFAVMGHAQPPPVEAAVKAAYLFRFAGYIEWPDGDLGDHPFVIDVSGGADVAAELRRLVPGHLINHRLVAVHEVSRAEEVDGAQVVYVGPEHEEFLRALRRRENEPVLVVTDEEQGLELGGVLNFLTVDKHVRFEVSLTAAEHAHLKISAELLAVAIRVQGGGRQSGEWCVPFRPPSDGNRCYDVRQARVTSLRGRRPAFRRQPPAA